MDSKKEHAAALQSAAARAAKAAYITKGSKTATWLCMPAYCYTVLCPDPGLRELPKEVRGWRE